MSDPTPLVTASRDALAEAIAPGAFAYEYRREVRATHGIPLGVAYAQDEAYDVADRLLASGAVRAVDGLAEDEALVERMRSAAGLEPGSHSGWPIGSLRALAAALATPTDPSEA